MPLPVLADEDIGVLGQVLVHRVDADADREPDAKDQRPDVWVVLETPEKVDELSAGGRPGQIEGRMVEVAKR